MEGRKMLALLLLALCGLVNGQGLDGGAPTDLSDCEVAVIGGGSGGVYSAYRLLETNMTTSVCLFEATGRLGGRIYSVHNLGPNRDLTLDMGAYRYMPLTQPLITELIERNLQLPNRLYQPGIPDYKIILDSGGSNAGFNTFVVALARKAIDMGLELDYNTRIVRLYSMADGSWVLQSAAGRNITADNVILNLPTRPLNRLMQASGLPRNGVMVNQAMQEVYQNRATKLYLFYPQAWWIANGLNNGSLAYNQLWNNSAAQGISPRVPIIGRYYDAQVKCATMASSGSVSASSVSRPQYVDYYYTAANSLNTQNCYGYIQATYTSDAGTTNISHMPLNYLADYASPTPGPDGIALPYTIWDNTTAMGMKLLNDTQTQFMAFLNSTNRTVMNMGMPTQAVVAFWDPSVDWSGGGWHSGKTRAAALQNATSQIIKPYANLNLYVADEAYSTTLGWAEGSLVMGENIVRSYFGGTTPSWMTANTARIIQYGDGYNDYENVAQGGGSGLAPQANLGGTLPASAGTAPTPARY